MIASYHVIIIVVPSGQGKLSGMAAGKVLLEVPNGTVMDETERLAIAALTRTPPSVSQLLTVNAEKYIYDAMEGAFLALVERYPNRTIIGDALNFYRVYTPDV